jgi:hypothetical protein
MIETGVKAGVAVQAAVRGLALYMKRRGAVVHSVMMRTCRSIANKRVAGGVTHEAEAYKLVGAVKNTSGIVACKYP